MLIVFISCKEEAVEFNAKSCKGSPAFIKTLGFDTRFSFLSTSDQKIMGLLLEQSEQPGNPNARITKIFQDSTWKKGGWLTPILIVGGNVPSTAGRADYHHSSLYLDINRLGFAKCKRATRSFILVKRVALLHFAPTHQQTSTPALSLQ